MNEKRFTTDYSDFIQNDKTFIKRGNERLTYKEIVDLLNEQQSKITELEKNFEDLVNWSTEISKRNVLLDEKIGRLQQENKELKNKLNKHL